METNWDQLIDRYLSNELSHEGRIAFEQMKKENPELEEAFQLHCLAIEGVKRGNQRLVIQQLGKSYHRMRKIKLYSLIAGSILVVGALGVYFMNELKQNETSKAQVQKIETRDQLMQEDESVSNENVEGIKEVADTLIEPTKPKVSIPKKEEIQQKRRNSVYSNISFDQALPKVATAPEKKETVFKMATYLEKNFVPELKISKVYAAFPINKKIRKVEVEGKLGAIDSLNNFVIQPIYDSLELVDWNRINHEKGPSEVQIMFSIKSTKFQYVYFYLVKKEDLQYLFNQNFQMITPKGYEKIETSFVYKQFIKVKKNGKYGLINENGIEVIPCEYDEISYKNGLKGILNGKKVKITLEEAN